MNRPRHRQRGTIALLYALLLPVMIGCVGLALDLGLMYLRTTQLQNAADSIAIAAALKLDGTGAGISQAVLRASQVAQTLNIDLATPLQWRSAALRFGPSADGSDWRSASAASTGAAALRYVRVDLAELDEEMRVMRPLMMGAFGADSAVEVVPVAVAGPMALQVAPLAICAMSAAPTATRTNPGPPDIAETVRYGLRPGIGYNLLDLNPNGTTPEYFLVDPVHAPGTPAAAFDDGAVAPFMCSGTLAYPAVGSARVHVRRPVAFNLWRELNSRFAPNAACNVASAPPDTNMRDYTGANASWMSVRPTRATAQRSTVGGKLRTVADLPPPTPASTPDADYGIRWAYGVPRGQAAANFATLYPSTPGVTVAMPLDGPYATPGYTTAPAQPGRPNRRLLHVPLLSCPVAAGTHAQASVVAFARFLLTAPASATEVPGEFVGIVSEAALVTAIGLHR
ncbi:pilus assembly protein TadG-related protein [Pseudoduganella chitinolytica]|uniref:Pilus assembly protein TadG-related protein n=1 Tax=Pseudoduganella chitinolytica TaxID=34070 RepID=A0ABY8BC30_9BURK|nr:pilus assembly protein TadG-related protein [Pseudoduganella chitinolytica]WEF32317.1 pilus assembly protein TadG-related protein [Pseudoduganella chitinolytica]